MDSTLSKVILFQITFHFHTDTFTSQLLEPEVVFGFNYLVLQCAFHLFIYGMELCHMF